MEDRRLWRVHANTKIFRLKTVYDNENLMFSQTLETVFKGAHIIYTMQIHANVLPNPIAFIFSVSIETEAVFLYVYFL